MDQQNEQLFVGVDEYDAPANALLFSPDQKQRDRFEKLAHLFKTQFFSPMKDAGSTIQKYWLTGVLPAFRDGISPLAATDIISSRPEYNGLCGFTDDEVSVIARTYLSPSPAADIELALDEIKRWDGGYNFSPDGGAKSLLTLYNPQQVFGHLRALKEKTEIRHGEHLHSSTILRAISVGPIPFRDFFLEALLGHLEATIMTAFGPVDMKRIAIDRDITWTLLYYFGVFTCGEARRLRIPNQAMTGLVRLASTISFSPEFNTLHRLQTVSEQS